MPDVCRIFAGVSGPPGTMTTWYRMTAEAAKGFDEPI
jgi:hypothetical protein